MVWAWKLGWSRRHVRISSTCWSSLQKQVPQVIPGSQWLSFLFSQFPNIYLCGFFTVWWKRSDLLKVVEGKWERTQGDRRSLETISLRNSSEASEAPPSSRCPLGFFLLHGVPTALCYTHEVKRFCLQGLGLNRSVGQPSAPMALVLPSSKQPQSQLSLCLNSTCTPSSFL